METAIQFLEHLYELDATAPNTGVVYKYVTEYVTTLKNTEGGLDTINQVLGNVRWPKLQPYTMSCLLRNCFSMRAHLHIWPMTLRVATTSLSQRIGPDETAVILRGLNQ